MPFNQMEIKIEVIIFYSKQSLSKSIQVYPLYQRQEKGIISVLILVLFLGESLFCRRISTHQDMWSIHQYGDSSETFMSSSTSNIFYH